MTQTSVCKTVDVTKMPENVLSDFLDGALSFDKAYTMYPGPDYSIDKLSPVRNKDCIDSATNDEMKIYMQRSHTKYPLFVYEGTR
jgi:hypothetical protein